MSTHFSRYPDDDGPEQAPCGVWIGDASDLSSDWSRVDCKRCLKWKDTIMATHEAEESAIVQQMGDMAEFMKREVRQNIDRPWSEYPIGTKAHAVMGGHWLKTVHGWKWCTGSTFPTPGGDATSVTLPSPAGESQ
ncbi:hypothetical protein [Pseudomonas sp. UBA7530]|uniref:hypothetical protein n=1 Tax=Pseudomonas sp. UBA7530 TaxID=1947341 RepID=UPI0025F4337C|nr:hypothetical protein [Pseudomonas sp. UBA7530]